MDLNFKMQIVMLRPRDGKCVMQLGVKYSELICNSPLSLKFNNSIFNLAKSILLPNGRLWLKAFQSQKAKNGYSKTNLTRFIAH